MNLPLNGTPDLESGREEREGWSLVYYGKENVIFNAAKVNLQLAHLLCPIMEKESLAILICFSLGKCQSSGMEGDEIYVAISTLSSNPQNDYMVQLLLLSSFMDEETETQRV